MSATRSGSEPVVRCGNCGADLGYPYKSASSGHVCPVTPAETDRPEGYVYDSSCPHCRNGTPHHREIGWATPAETGLDEMTTPPCARYFGSDGTLCAIHSARFLSDTSARCSTALAPTPADPRMTANYDANRPDDWTLPATPAETGLREALDGLLRGIAHDAVDHRGPWSDFLARKIEAARTALSKEEK